MATPGATAEDGRNGRPVPIQSHVLAASLHVVCTECPWVSSGPTVLDAAVSHVAHRGHSVIITEWTPTLISPTNPTKEAQS